MIRHDVHLGVVRDIACGERNVAAMNVFDRLLNNQG